MTPSDIATDVSGIKPVDDNSAPTLSMGTQSFVGKNWGIDDWT